MGRKKYITSFLCAFSLFSFFACTQRNSTVKPNEIRLYLEAEPYSIDPRIGGNRISQTVVRELFEGLTRLGKDGNPELALAKSISVSDDDLTHTISLHPSVWSNGDPVTAHDFVYAWKSIIDPSFPTSFAYALYDIKNAQKAQTRACSLDEIGIRALDDLTLEVTFEYPTPYSLELFANPIFSPVHRPSAQKNKQWAAQTYPEFVSNGPFIVKKHDLNSRIILETNPLYSKKRAEKTLSFTIINDPNTAFNLFKANELDWFGDPCGTFPIEFLNNKETSLYTKDTGGSFWIECHVTTPHLASPKIRKALAMSIDRKTICQGLLNNTASPSFSILPNSLTLLETPTFEDGNAEKAKKLFKEGLDELNITDYPPLHLMFSASPKNKILAELVQKQIQNALGITVNLAPSDSKTWFQKVSSGDFEISLSHWFTWFNDQYYNLKYLKHKDGGMNGTDWEDPNYISLINQAISHSQTTSRKHYFKQAEQLVMDQMPIIPLFCSDYTYLKPPNLMGEILSSTGQMEFQWLEKVDQCDYTNRD